MVFVSPKLFPSPPFPILRKNAKNSRKAREGSRTPPPPPAKKIATGGLANSSKLTNLELIFGLELSPRRAHEKLAMPLTWWNFRSAWAPKFGSNCHSGSKGVDMERWEQLPELHSMRGKSGKQRTRNPKTPKLHLAVEL